MLRHEQLLRIAENLGYDFTSFGMCHGFTLRWLEAGLIGQQNKFDSRVGYLTNIVEKYESRYLDLKNKIITGEQKELSPQDIEFLQLMEKELNDEAIRVTEEINDVKDKVKQNLPINTSEVDLLEIPSFFESIALYSTPDRFPDIFGALLCQLNINEISTLAASDAISGGLMSLYSEPVIATSEEIEAYLNELAQAVKEAEYTQNVGFLLSEFSHSMGLMYNPTSDEWCFLDISNFPPVTSIREISSILLKAGAPFIAMNVSAIIPAHSTENSVTLKAVLSQMKERHVITSDMAQRQANVNLLTIAAQHGHADFVKKLCEAGANLNPSEQICTPLFIATHAGHLDCMKALVAHGADINQVDKHGTHSLIFPVARGEADVVNWLFEQGAIVEPFLMRLDQIYQFGNALKEKYPGLGDRFDVFFDTKIRPQLASTPQEESDTSTFYISQQDIESIIRNNDPASTLKSESIKDRLDAIKNSSTLDQVKSDSTHSPKL